MIRGYVSGQQKGNQMSTAGIRSNRGDIYQTLVAFDWALTVLSDPDFQWIEIDSTAHGVDDEIEDWLVLLQWVLTPPISVGSSKECLCPQLSRPETPFRTFAVVLRGLQFAGREISERPS
jgi:hypothetical protein